MIAMVIVFFMFLVLFGFIGASRGWAREVLVIASVILTLAIIALFEDLLNLDAYFNQNRNLQFAVRTTLLIVMVYFGYMSPKVQRIAKATEKRGQIAERILGFLMGMTSGYFVIGTLWSFAQYAGYPLMVDYISAPPKDLVELTNRVLAILPPNWLNTPLETFIALVVIFVFVIIYLI
jgi:uncharacterized membrane protein required for colicin V production